MKQVSLLFGGIVAMSMFTASGAEHLVGGKSVNDVFADPSVARLAAAACDGNINKIREALKTGVNVNAVGFEESTPLMWALSCDNIVGMEALLKAGANPNQMVKHFSPVYAAATRYNPGPLKLLLRYGGDPNAEDIGTGVSALRKAEAVGMDGHGWDNYYAIFKSKSIDVNRTDHRGDTIAVELSRDGQFDKLSEVLESGYIHDLVDLGSMVQIVSNKIYDEKQTASLKKVRRLLEEHGVKLPPAPIPTIR